jgi:hypothetical protein
MMIKEVKNRNEKLIGQIMETTMDAAVWVYLDLLVQREMKVFLDFQEIVVLLVLLVHQDLVVKRVTEELLVTGFYLKELTGVEHEEQLSLKLPINMVMLKLLP